MTLHVHIPLLPVKVCLSALLLCACVHSGAGMSARGVLSIMEQRKASFRSTTTSSGSLSSSSYRTHLSGSGTPTPTADGRGYTLSPCERNEECVGNRRCFRTMENRPLTTEECDAAGTPAQYCVCHYGFESVQNIKECISCHQCDDWPSETCQRVSNLETEDAACLSVWLLVKERITVEVGCNTFPNVTPIDFNSPSPTPSTSITTTPSTSISPSPSPGECIDARVTRAHLHPHDTLFLTDRPAIVLCDKYESCATPGHMVVFHGKPMSMRSYCASLSTANAPACTRKVVLVNSPRYKTALRLPSNTAGLEFTALAARFETAVEEATLRMAIKFGL